MKTNTSKSKKVKAKFHKHYWDTTGLPSEEREYYSTSTSPLVRQYVLIICHECGEVNKKYL